MVRSKAKRPIQLTRLVDIRVGDILQEGFTDKLRKRLSRLEKKDAVHDMYDKHLLGASKILESGKAYLVTEIRIYGPDYESGDIGGQTHLSLVPLATGAREVDRETMKPILLYAHVAYREGKDSREVPFRCVGKMRLMYVQVE